MPLVYELEPCSAGESVEPATLPQGALPPAKLFRLQLSVHGSVHKLADFLLKDLVASCVVALREI